MIALYNPVSSAGRKPVLPLSLLALGTMLEGRENYEIVDGNLVDDPVSALTSLLDGHKRPILGVTVMPGPQLADAVPVCRELKRRHPALKIVWGGYFPTQHFEAVLRSGLVDLVLRGHGETVFPEVAAQLSRAENPEDLPGLAYRRPDPAEIVAGPPITPPDPEELPDFPYEKLPMERYVRRTFMGRTLSHHSSYGCPFLCNFCAVVNLSKGRWKAQSAERTAGTVRRLAREWGAQAVEFFDNNFFVDEGRVREFSERVRPLNIQWWGEARIDTLLRFSDDTWAAMAAGGLRMVFMGAESGSDETLGRMHKGGRATTDQTLQIAEKTARYGIVPEFSFILGSPPDPEGDSEKTLRFVRRIKQVNPMSEIIFYLYTPVPFSGGLFEEVRSRGFRFPETLDEWLNPEWMEFALRRSHRLPWVEQRLTRRIRNFERVMNAYYPTSTDPRLTGVRRLALRAASAWRYRLNILNAPVELSLLQRLFHYQRPETSGF